MEGYWNSKIEDGKVIVEVNPKIYSMETIYSAAYTFIDRAYILLDGNPQEKVIVVIKPKEDASLERLGDEFNNELVHYADYLARAKRTKKLRETFLQRALITNDPGMRLDNQKEDFSEINDQEEDLYDPESIAVPWGRKNEGKTK